MAIDWSKAPEGAEFYAYGLFRKDGGTWHFDIKSASGEWRKSSRRQSFFMDVHDYEERPETQADQQWPEEWLQYGYSVSVVKEFEDHAEHTKQWPENDERIDRIGRDRTAEDMGHYDEQREQHEQAQPTAPQANKYDRTIIGKYGSGKCTVDVYRVLNAFPSGSPEIDHALKKLLAPGKRGVKSELQDLREAIQSIEARISYLSELGEK